MAAACLSEMEAMSPADRCGFIWPEACYKDFDNGCLGMPGDGCRTSGDCALSTRGQISCLQYDPENDQWMCQLTAVGEVGDGPCTKKLVYWLAGLTPSVVFECDTSKNLVCDATTNRCVADATPVYPIPEYATGTSTRGARAARGNVVFQTVVLGAG